MPDDPSTDTAPTTPTPEAVNPRPAGDSGSDAEVIGVSNPVDLSPADDRGSSASPAGDRGSDAGVIGVSTGDAEVIGESTAAGNALDLVDEVLEALDQDELERAEELAERLESPDPPDEN